MNRRGFLKRMLVGVSTLLPISILSYDPIKQSIIKPKIDNSNLVGYKGHSFFETGYVYYPYIPLYSTKN